MPDFMDKMKEQRSWLEWLVGKVPGYSGYKAKEMRREADSLLRDHIIIKLKEQLSRAENVTSQLLTGPGISQLDDMGRGNSRLQTLIDKVDSAPQGYSGFFDAIRIKEAELDALYEFDYNMLMQVEVLTDAINSVQSALNQEGNLPGAVQLYIDTVTELSNRFDTRYQKMIEMS